jgi:hypothetical protein
VTDQLISASITVDAPPSVVFAILADPRQHDRIDGSGSVGSVIAGPERITAKGQTFTVRMKLFGVPYLIMNRVVEYEADRSTPPGRTRPPTPSSAGRSSTSATARASSPPWSG